MVESRQEEVSRALGARGLLTVLNGLEGVDHHDWYQGVAREIGLTKHQLFPILFNIWISGEGNADACDVVYSEIKKRITAENIN